MHIRVVATVAELNRLAAAQAASVLASAIAARGHARLVAATGSSQLGFLETLVATAGIDWSRVTLFHLDEYLDLPGDHPASFARFMRDRLVVPTGITDAHLIDGLADSDQTIAALTQALRLAPIDLALTGIGENGHLAFNEPPADFATTAAFAVVSLDETSRRQQVGEGWFERLADVPRRAITMTVPEILKARDIICLVHGTRKASAVAACFNGAPTPLAPASQLSSHGAATVYLDPDAAGLLEPSVVSPPS